MLGPGPAEMNLALSFTLIVTSDDINNNVFFFFRFPWGRTLEKVIFPQIFRIYFVSSFGRWLLFCWPRFTFHRLLQEFWSRSWTVNPKDSFHPRSLVLCLLDAQPHVPWNLEHARTPKAATKHKQQWIFPVVWTGSVSFISSDRFGKAQFSDYFFVDSLLHWHHGKLPTSQVISRRASSVKRLVRTESFEGQGLSDWKLSTTKNKNENPGEFFRGDHLLSEIPSCNIPASAHWTVLIYTYRPTKIRKLSLERVWKTGRA